MTHIAVCTPLYNTPAQTLARTWASLRAQEHTNWSWWIWDDSTHDGPWRQLWGYCADTQYRIHPMRGISNIGSIGTVKRRIMMAAEADILVELDHDDELTPDALTEIQQAFDTHPDVGFVYSDWCEINEQGEWCRYPEGWAFGYGADYQIAPNRWVMSAPPINATTMSHIVSVPNHVRAWRADVYRALNGHNPEMRVADDYELLLRTFLSTRMLHIPKLLYRQYIGNTAQRRHNKEIQDNVARLSAMYQPLIEERARELGL